MTHTLHVVLFGLFFAGCASSASTHPAASPTASQAAGAELHLAPMGDLPPAAPPQGAGDIQFTMTERKAKAAPSTDETQAATTLQPTKSNTSGMISTGVTTQRVRALP